MNDKKLTFILFIMSFLPILIVSLWYVLIKIITNENENKYDKIKNEVAKSPIIDYTKINKNYKDLDKITNWNIIYWKINIETTKEEKNNKNDRNKEIKILTNSVVYQKQKKIDFEKIYKDKWNFLLQKLLEEIKNFNQKNTIIQIKYNNLLIHLYKEDIVKVIYNKKINKDNIIKIVLEINSMLKEGNKKQPFDIIINKKYNFIKKVNEKDKNITNYIYTKINLDKVQVKYVNEQDKYNITKSDYLLYLCQKKWLKYNQQYLNLYKDTLVSICYIYIYDYLAHNINKYIEFKEYLKKTTNLPKNILDLFIF